MSQGLNEVNLIGRLTRDPELGQTKTTGADVANFSLAMNSRYRVNGEYRETVEYVNVIVFGTLAVHVFDNLRKGSKIYVGGRMSTRQWTDSQNIDRKTTSVIAEKCLFLSDWGDK